MPSDDGQPAILARPVTRIGGTIGVPGDKSISHRAVLLGAVADGLTTVRGFLRGEDCLATLAAMRSLGVHVDDSGETLVIHGAGMAGLEAADGPLDLGNSGTALRLLAGVLAAQPFASELTGDASLCRRPMERIAEPLRIMGADVATSGGCPPLRIAGGATLHGIDYSLPVPSAQIKSAVLLAGLWANGRTTVRSPGPSRDHTERMLQAMGVSIELAGDGVVTLAGPAQLTGLAIDVPADFSSAAFFIVAGLLGADDGLLIRGVGVNPTRTGLLDVLRDMGAHIELRNPGRRGNEPVADIWVERSELHGVDVGGDAVALSIDELPVLFIAAACAQGRTTVTGAGELRHKESDRIAVMAQGLRAVGIAVEERPDGLIIDGGPMQGGRVESRGDHRVAMAFTVASLAADAPIEIRSTAEVATSFPGFTATAASVGLALEACDERS
ncbi:MAG: 3-phosphoshikimate 1-carboxyvinyltransferase [Gammaproteobacteria bacterium]|nr:3-phosphoshikimate 1-carboxyvinyltransferase [Gammaproteobacteria bacterium]